MNKAQSHIKLIQKYEKLQINSMFQFSIFTEVGYSTDCVYYDIEKLVNGNSKRNEKSSERELTEINLLNNLFEDYTNSEIKDKIDMENNIENNQCQKIPMKHEIDMDTKPMPVCSMDVRNVHNERSYKNDNNMQTLTLFTNIAKLILRQAVPKYIQYRILYHIFKKFTTSSNDVFIMLIYDLSNKNFLKSTIIYLISLLNFPKFIKVFDKASTLEITAILNKELKFARVYNKYTIQEKDNFSK